MAWYYYMHLQGTTIDQFNDQFNDYYKFCSVVAIWAIPLVDQVPKCYKNGGIASSSAADGGGGGETGAVFPGPPV